MPKTTEIPAVVNAAGGAIAGVVSNVLLFPLDLVTVRLQVQHQEDPDSPTSTPKKEYEGILDAFKRIYDEEGLSSFYEGVVSDSGATMIQAFLYFFAYDFVRNRRLHHIERNTGKLPRTLSTPEELLAGSLAGIFCKFFTAPLNNLVVLKQAAPTFEDGESIRDMSSWKAVQEMYKTRGLAGFWAGYKATILLSINPSLTYYFFQHLSARIVPRSRRHSPRALEVFISAAIAKSLATLITYPVILVKTRIQASTSSHHKDLPLYAAVWHIAKEQGLRGLYNGANGQIIKGFFSQGLTMMTKDRIAHTIVYLYLITRGQTSQQSLTPLKTAAAAFARSQRSLRAI